MSARKQDVTQQIGQIKNMADEDINDDGFIGEPNILEDEPIIKSVVYDNLEGEIDRSIYKIKGGKVLLAEQGLDVNDVPWRATNLARMVHR